MSTGPGNGRGEAATTHIPADDGAPTEALVAGTVGDRCVNCGASLSSDQRYCVNCGERRGQPRFSLAQQQRSAAAPAGSPAPIRRSRRPRISGGATLVAGVGTLLLAMGVGVLIGHNSAGNNNSKAAATPQVITVQGGGSSSGGGASTSAGTGGSSASSPSGSSNSGGSSHAKHKSSGGPKHKGGGSSAKKPAASASKPPPPVVVHKAAQAAAKVLGGSAKNVPPPTVTQGQNGSGPGFNKKTHKFDGSFFGG